VVCAARVARDVATATGGVSIVHQHGCSQVGDDAVRTGQVFEDVACSPNVGATLVIGLGCETLEGHRLASRIEQRGQSVEFTGIQDAGGSKEAVATGVAACTRLLAELAGSERAAVAPAKLTIGIEAARASPLVDALARRLAEAGASVALTGHAGGLQDRWSRAAAFSSTPPRPYRVVLQEAGHGVQQHLALIAAGVQAIVSFPALDAAPVGSPVCPVLAVRGSSPLHSALAGDFDLSDGDGIDVLWRRMVETIDGAPTVAERLGSSVFALERLAMTM
jgi:altronate dehydratase